MLGDLFFVYQRQADGHVGFITARSDDVARRRLAREGCVVLGSHLTQAAALAWITARNAENERVRAGGGPDARFGGAQ